MERHFVRLLVVIIGCCAVDVSAQSTVTVFVPATGSVTFQSPNHPNNYYASALVTYRIISAGNEAIELNALVFNTETNYDNIQFTETLPDGTTQSLPAAGSVYSGTVGPIRLRSLSGNVTAIFRTDESGQLTGFKIACAVVPCGSVYEVPATGAPVAIQSPNNYTLLANNGSCDYTFTAPDGARVELSQSPPDESWNCEDDVLLLSEMVNGSTVVTRKPFCEKNRPNGPSRVQSQSNSVTVVFKSNAAVNRAQFQILVHITQPCRTSLQVPAAGVVRFQSPHFPLAYFHDEVCTYTLQAPAGAIIQFDAEAFSLEGDSCAYDRVNFAERINGSVVAIGNPFCGTVGPYQLRSSTNIVDVTFQTDSSVALTGFKIAARVSACPRGKSLCPGTSGSSAVCIASTQYNDGVANCPNSSDERLPEECGNPLVEPNIGQNAGRAAVPHSWPWQVALVLAETGEQVCGGSILSDKWILTAGHCCQHSSAAAATKNFKVRVGAHDLRSHTEESAKTIDLINLILHPQYDHLSAAPQYDFCLLQTSERLVFNSETIAPVCLDSGAEDFVGQTCWATGWGSAPARRHVVQPGLQRLQLDENPINTEANNFLHQIPLIINSQSACSATWASYITPQMICATTDRKSSTCNNDSGGPLVCMSQSGTFKVVGISSRVASGCDNPDHPLVFARTSAAAEWIAQTLFNHSSA
ncbi:putative Ovochymase-2 [Hypsibius exemplaris]|uniref:Ovochymase-2 n=1 Tax=Hypsibius exemplaris TaxID=2072580 RepID=A0A1W0X2D1_HYPEX|nr:putative Ovochymase-2 [Hypsibius exemplaris]